MIIGNITQKDLAKQEIAIYKSKSGKIAVDIKLLDDTLWLSLNQITDLFERDKSAISRHLKNIFDTEELQQSSVVAKFATTASDGKPYNVDYYNLDAIISVGYRVNSKRGTEFRKWSTQILKEHLIKGYSINQKQLNQKSITELQQTIDLLSRTAINQDLATDIGAEMLQIIKDYTRTWDTLRKEYWDRNRAETMMSRFKTTFSSTLASRKVESQKNEIMLKCQILNTLASTAIALQESAV